MLYQLPNGQVLQLSLAEYLDMSDQELHELTNSGAGTEPSQAMYYGKGVRDAEVKPPIQEEIPLDYTPESEDLDKEGPVDVNDLPGS
jgi:hypothetical protein